MLKLTSLLLVTLCTTCAHWQINSSGLVAAVLQRELGSPSVKLSLSGMIDHVRGQSAFGMSFDVQL